MSKSCVIMSKVAKIVRDTNHGTFPMILAARWMTDQESILLFLGIHFAFREDD